jgi:hypothetical protein
MTTIKMIKTAQTGAHYGKKGETLTVPEAVAANWVALGVAEPTAPQPPKKTAATKS